ncbi:hypothetical protein BDV18DRAFT_157841 [Aspergillus unguis]
MLHTRLRPLRLANHPPSSDSSHAPPENESRGALSDEEVEEDPEDLFASFIRIPNLLPDDLPHTHGEPGQLLLYSSPRYGDVRIMVPSYPDQEDKDALPPGDSTNNGTQQSRSLWAHFLWVAGLVVAEGIERADSGSQSEGDDDDDDDDDAAMWKVQGEEVLELGAGAGLPSIIAGLAGASKVTITDHPSSAALRPGGAISFNVKQNLSATNCSVDFRPHEWGTTLTTDPWAAATKSSYTRIIAADCFWLGSQHENLARTMKWFLAPTGRIWVVGGFHTGRSVLAGFFEAAIRMGLEIEKIYERDLNTSFEEGGEFRREWVDEREGEGPENRRRWCVVALLKHASEASA